MKNIAIIGASYLQLPLILKAKQMGYTTHVFAWAANDAGEKEADYFYPISIVEKEEILQKCKEIGICGVCSIASDLAIITVNYVAQHLELVSNDMECTYRSTNKHLMRECFEKNGDPSPISILVESENDPRIKELSYPLIVKPMDRSGSRGITKINSFSELGPAIALAKNEGFEKKALVEEYLTGNEYSVECVSWEGEHHFLALTKKYTTGSPNYIETGHLEMSGYDKDFIERVRTTVFHALNSLGIRYGASHSEIKVSEDGKIGIVEIGGRMGGDFIGSNLVELSTGYDFVKAVIDVCVGKKPAILETSAKKNAGVIFIMNRNDINTFEKVNFDPDFKLIDHEIDYDHFDDNVTDSSNRHGYFIFTCDNRDKILSFMNDVCEEG